MIILIASIQSKLTAFNKLSTIQADRSFVYAGQDEFENLEHLLDKSKTYTRGLAGEPVYNVRRTDPRRRYTGRTEVSGEPHRRGSARHSSGTVEEGERVRGKPALGAADGPGGSHFSNDIGSFIQYIVPRFPGAAAERN